uniref:IS66 family transposase zinc-finger binding domain-containing protein n=1 Tax=Lactobacillus ultunensis TaxID=227945 RepID=UPI0023B7C07A|nr:hypothetical protein [Lactobacillus ultunensis]
MGNYSVRQELLFIPAQLKYLDHIQHAYKCQYCNQRNPSNKIIKAAVPKALFNPGLGLASLIAHTLYPKYELKIQTVGMKARKDFTIFIAQARDVTTVVITVLIVIQLVKPFHIIRDALDKQNGRKKLK